jgi:hypothetical protein
MKSIKYKGLVYVVAGVQNFHVVRINRDKNDVFAATTYNEAMELANPDPSDHTENSTVRAKDAGEARLLAIKLPNSEWNHCANPNA